MGEQLAAPTRNMGEGLKSRAGYDDVSMVMMMIMMMMMTMTMTVMMAMMATLVLMMKMMMVCFIFCSQTMSERSAATTTKPTTQFSRHH